MLFNIFEVEITSAFFTSVAYPFDTCCTAEENSSSFTFVNSHKDE